MGNPNWATLSLRRGSDVEYSMEMESVVLEGLKQGNTRMAATLAKSVKYAGVRATDELIL